MLYYEVYKMSEIFQDAPHEEPPNYQTFERATVGIRKKLLSQKRSQIAQYQIVNISFNALAIAQIAIGAAITALGPLGGQHMLAITILGAFNTSIAGLLALLKGRGLPQRLRRNLAEVTKVLDRIEEATVLLRYGSRRFSKKEIDALIQDVMKRYATANDIIETNQPDTYANGEFSQPHTSVTAVESSPSQRTHSIVINGKQRARDEEMGTNESL